MSEEIAKVLEKAIVEIESLKVYVKELEQRIEKLESSKDVPEETETLPKDIELSKYPNICGYLNSYIDDAEDKKIRKKDIAELNLSVRAYNCCYRAGYKTVGDLLQASESEVIRIRNLGQQSYIEVVDKIKSLGYTWWPKQE